MEYNWDSSREAGVPRGPLPLHPECWPALRGSELVLPLQIEYTPLILLDVYRNSGMLDQRTPSHSCLPSLAISCAGEKGNGRHALPLGA